MGQKGFDPRDIIATVKSPEKAYKAGRNSKYAGQWRLTGNGVCIMAKMEGTVLVLLTVVEDDVLTPPRPDQLLTPEGREYAARYAAGLGRKG